MISIFEVKTSSVNSETQRIATDGSPLYLGANPQLCRDLFDSQREVRFDFEANVTKLKQYQNLFQTADINDGLRLEVDSAGNVGVVARSRTDPSLLVGLNAFGIFMTDAVNTVSVTVRRGTYVGISVNGSRENIAFMPFVAECTNFAVGTGFDASRSIEFGLTLKVTRSDLATVTYFGWPESVRAYGRSIFLGALVFLAAITARSSRKREG
jgi:hypothetical protein